MTTPDIAGLRGDMASREPSPTTDAARSQGETLVPDGWVAVPVEPNALMMEAGVHTIWPGDKVPGHVFDDARSIYRAMLSAAPASSELSERRTDAGQVPGMNPLPSAPEGEGK